MEQGLNRPAYPADQPADSPRTSVRSYSITGKSPDTNYSTDLPGKDPVQRIRPQTGYPGPDPYYPQLVRDEE